MKKIIMAVMAAATLLFTGCEKDETVLVNGATTAGSLAMLTWFSIDNPDQEVKVVLKDIVDTITKSTVAVGEGKTYLDSVLPNVQEIVLKQEKLTDYQKQLINAGAVVILNGIDTYLATNEKVKANVELVNKVVGAFGKGCQSVLILPDDCPECQVAKKAYATRNVKVRGGKFVVDAPAENKKAEAKPEVKPAPAK